MTCDTTAPMPTDQGVPPEWPVHSSWTPRLQSLFATPQFQTLQSFVSHQRREHRVYPPPSQTFAAFAATPWEAVRVVILGQDPYHGPQQAEGLSFSVPSGTPLPPSLRNILKELQADLGIVPGTQGSLRSWAQQGVLLLNTVLTVRDGEPQSHSKQGWEWFTDQIIQLLVADHDPILFLLWGAPAQKKQNLIHAPHGILAAAHPSPLSAHRGFFGSRPFSQCNAWLQARGYPGIDWRLT